MCYINFLVRIFRLIGTFLFLAWVIVVLDQEFFGNELLNFYNDFSSIVFIDNYCDDLSFKAIVTYAQSDSTAISLNFLFAI